MKVPENGFRLFKAGDGPLQILTFTDGRVGPEVEPNEEILRDLSSGKLKLGLYDENFDYIGPEVS